MTAPTRSAASVHYKVEAADLHAHLFRVTLSIDQPAAQQRVSLPVWIPGSYLVREFSKNLQKLAGKQGAKPVAVHQLDKASWQVECVPSQPLVLSYEVYAFDTIPSTMNSREVIIICGIAVVASILGAVIPAMHAAWMDPVEALRWE